MIRKIVSWVKSNPILTFLIVFMTVQTIINAVLAMRIIQVQEALKRVILRLSLQTWRV